MKASPAPSILPLTAPISNALKPAARSWEDSGCLNSSLDSSALLKCHDWESQNYCTQYSCHVDEVFPGFCHQLRPRKLHSAPATKNAESSPFSVSAPSYHKRRFICGICGKGFGERRKLHDHTRSHMGERPFRCSYAQCGRAFSIKSNKQRHEKKCPSGPRILINPETCHSLNDS